MAPFFFFYPHSFNLVTQSTWRKEANSSKWKCLSAWGESENDDDNQNHVLWWQNNLDGNSRRPKMARETPSAIVATTPSSGAVNDYG